MLSRREFLARSAVAGVGGLLAPAALRAQSAPTDIAPNILWILTSEQRWDSVAAASKYSWLKTPNLDKLAAEGALFTEAYCQSPSPVASRVAMLTGRYCHQTGVYASFEYHHDEAACSLPFFTQHLRQKGYAVMSVGRECHNRVSRKDPYTPDGKAYNQISAFPTFAFRDIWQLGPIPYPPLRPDNAEQETRAGILRRTGTRLQPIVAGTSPLPADKTQTALITDKALECLQSRVPANTAVFLRVAYLAPHTPVLPPAPFATMYDAAPIPPPDLDPAVISAMPVQTKNLYNLTGVQALTEPQIRRLRASYFAFCSHLDDQIGRLVGQFKLRSTLQKRPWVILFCSDHGCMLGDYGMHEKWAFYGPSVKVPLIAAASDARFPKGKVCSDLVELVDVPVTFLKAGATQVPPELVGRDLVEVASGRVPPRKYVISERKDFGRRAMLRTQDWAFEMQLGPSPDSTAPLLASGIEHLRKLPVSELDVSLFDVRMDPEQRQDMGQAAAHKTRCEKLRDFLLKRICGSDRVEVDWSQEVPPPPNAEKQAKGAEASAI